MKILAINYEYPPLGGGGGVVFKDIYDELAKTHEITIITTHFKGLDRYEQVGNQKIYRVPVLFRKELATATIPSLLTYFPASLRKAKQLMKANRFDLINSHFAVPSSPSADIVARKYGVPHALSLHGGDLYDPSKGLSPHKLPVVRGMVRRLLHRADRLLAQSQNTAENARKYYGVERPIDVIPLGIVPPEVNEIPRKQLEIGDDRFVMITIGRLIPRKGLEGLIESLKKMNDPRDLLVIVGDGPLLGELGDMARRIGVEDRIMLTGFVTDERKYQLLAASDIYVSTTLHEGFGLVFLEAMHCGLPIACYDNGGQTDFLEDGKTGALVPLGDLDQFVGSVEKLKVDDGWRRECSGFNLRHVREYYVDRCAERHQEIFEEMIRGRTS